MYNLTLVTDINAIIYNINCFKKMLNSGVKLVLMVKADAYGHGMCEVAIGTEPTVDCFGVMNAYEGAVLRQAGITKPIMVMAVDSSEISQITELDLQPFISNTATLNLFEQALARKNKKLEYHIKVDTGMGRFGINSQSEFEGFINFASSLKQAKPASLASHFSSGDSDNLIKQNNLFKQYAFTAIKKFNNLSLQISATSALNNSCLFNYNLVRLGIGAYGYESKFDLQPALNVSSSLILIKTIFKGKSVGYNSLFTATTDMQIGVVRGGYADGFRRAFNNGAVIINGKKCKIVGNICMDCFMVDLTDIVATCRDDVIIIGEQNGNKISASDLAQQANTISYEILTGFKGRCERIILK